MFLILYILTVTCVQVLSAVDEDNCAKKSQQFQSILKAAQSGRLMEVTPPQCDQDGSFSPVQCSGTTCYCVSKDGDRLFRNHGSLYQDHMWHQHEMDCQCARHQYEYKKAGLIGQIFHCSTNGNYASKGEKTEI